MRVTLFFLLAIMIGGANVMGQTPLEEAVDFETTDINENSVHLFELLEDQNKFVVIDFFFASCGPCQNSAPYVNEAFEYFGCGDFDVEFISISDRDSDAVCHEFDETYGVTYTTISGIEGNGAEIVSNYQIQAFPTIILIDPEGNIVEQDIYPIVNEYSVINPLESYGIIQSTCLTHIYEKTEVLDIKIFPNPTTGLFSIESPSNTTSTVELYNNYGNLILSVNDIGLIQFDVGYLEKGVFTIHVISNNRTYYGKIILL